MRYHSFTIKLTNIFKIKDKQNLYKFYVMVTPLTADEDVNGC